MSTRFGQSLEMSRLTRDGTAKTVSRDQFSGADREKLIFPVQLTTCMMGNLTRLIHTLAICVTMHNVGERPTIITVHYIYRHRCFSHSAYWSPTRKTILHCGQSRSSCSAEQRNLYSSLLLALCTRYVCMVNTTFSRVWYGSTGCR